jgi:hypothetical protein
MRNGNREAIEQIAPARLAKRADFDCCRHQACVLRDGRDTPPGKRQVEVVQLIPLGLAGPGQPSFAT